MACLKQTAMTNKTSGEALWVCVSRQRLKEQQRPAEKCLSDRTSHTAHTCVVSYYISNAQKAASVRKGHSFSLFNDLRNGLSFKSKWCRPNPRPQRPAGLELRKLEIVLTSKKLGTSLISMIDHMCRTFIVPHIGRFRLGKASEQIFCKMLYRGEHIETPPVSERV